MQWRSSPWIDIVNTEAYILFVRSVIHTSTSQILKLCSLSKLIIFSFIPTSIHVPGALHPRHNSPLPSSMRRFSPRRTKKTQHAQSKKKRKKRRHRNLAISIRYRVLFAKGNVQAHFYSFFWPSFLPLRVLVQRALEPDTCMT
jgi:hypothetical protein